MNILYHYTTLDGLYGIIENNCIHATHISYLNDPSEEKYFEYILNKLLNVNKEAEYTYEILYDAPYEIIFDNYEKYIISFCELPDSLSMWNYYSKGNGFNLGFQLNNMIDRSRKIIDFKLLETKIVYNEEDQLKILSDYLSEHQNSAKKFEELKRELENSKTKKNNIYSIEQDKLIANFMDGLSVIKKKFKHPSYSDEREVRLIIETSDKFNQIFYRKTLKGCLIPFIKIPITLNNDIISITLHPLQNKLGINGLKHFIKNKKLFHIQIKESEIPFREP